MNEYVRIPLDRRDVKVEASNEIEFGEFLSERMKCGQKKERKRKTKKD